MRKKIHDHLPYVLSLITIIVLGILLALQFSYSKQAQMLVVVIITFLYVGIGLFHHKENHDLTSKIVVEYTLIGALGMTIVSFLLVVSL